MTNTNYQHLKHKLTMKELNYFDKIMRSTMYGIQSIESHTIDHPDDNESKIRLTNLTNICNRYGLTGTCYELNLGSFKELGYGGSSVLAKFLHKILSVDSKLLYKDGKCFYMTGIDLSYNLEYHAFEVQFGEITGRYLVCFDQADNYVYEPESVYIILDEGCRGIFESALQMCISHIPKDIEIKLKQLDFTYYSIKQAIKKLPQKDTKDILELMNPQLKEIEWLIQGYIHQYGSGVKYFTRYFHYRSQD